MTAWHIAQLNVGTALYDVDDSRMAGFTGQLDAINALADAAPGFVWRLQSESGNATDIKLTPNPRFIVNLSVWDSIEALFDFAYKTPHAKVMAGRRKWFARPESDYQALWWLPAGSLPTAEEALERLALLQEQGPTAQAFTFKSRFPPPE